MTLTVLVNAGPWLPVPPSSYGGSENLLFHLIPELRRLGHRVVLATVGESAIEVDERVWTFQEGQLRRIAAPYVEVVGIAQAHMRDVIETIRNVEAIDVVHDALEVVGPSMLSALGPDCPPVLHTLQWDLRNHPEFYQRFNGGGRVFFNGISEPQMARASESVRRHSVGVVHNGVDPRNFHFRADKDKYCITLARFSPDKGQDIAARVCRRLGVPLRMAGTVGGIESPKLLFEELLDRSSPFRDDKDVRYYLEAVRPCETDEITWVGSVGGDDKKELIAGARALLMPRLIELPARRRDSAGTAARGQGAPEPSPGPMADPWVPVLTVIGDDAGAERYPSGLLRAGNEVRMPRLRRRTNLQNGPLIPARLRRTGIGRRTASA